MAQFDAETLIEQAVLIGLIHRGQAREAIAEAEDGTIESIGRSLLRKGLLTSWQLEKLLKGDLNGFFYGPSKILFHIAEGTFARVYRGRREPGNQSVAVKVLRRRFSNDPDAVARFYHEAEAGEKLVHPNIVRIFDFGEQDRSHYMVMEYVEGSNLRDFLKLRHRIHAEQALPLLIGLAQALAFSLKQGITHRDIKATNILISHSGEAKLVDFGLATIEGDQKKMEQMHGVRTVDYASLERNCGSPKGDPRSDIYFLGCVFYQMLTGQPPLPETQGSDPLQKMLKRSFGAIRPISEMPNAPPPALAAIIEKMMTIDLKKRYSNMDAVVADLLAFQDAPHAAPAPPPKPVAAPAIDDEEEVPQDGLESSVFEVPAFRQKQVLCIEAQEPIQEAFRKQLSGMGFRVILVRDGELGLERYRDSTPDLVIYDADGQGRSALEHFLRIYEEARENRRTLLALVLLGPRQAGLKSQLPTDARLVVLDKPAKMRDVQDALEQLVPA